MFRFHPGPPDWPARLGAPPSPALPPSSVAVIPVNGEQRRRLSPDHEQQQATFGATRSQESTQQRSNGLHDDRWRNPRHFRRCPQEESRSGKSQSEIEAWRRRGTHSPFLVVSYFVSKYIFMALTADPVCPASTFCFFRPPTPQPRLRRFWADSFRWACVRGRGAVFAGGTGALVSVDANDTNALKSAAAVNEATRVFIRRTLASRLRGARGIVATRGEATREWVGLLHVCSTSERVIATEPDALSGGLSRCGKKWKSPGKPGTWFRSMSDKLRTFNHAASLKSVELSVHRGGSTTAHAL